MTAAAAMARVLRDVAPACRSSSCRKALMNGVVGFNIHRGCLALAERPTPQPLEPADLARCRRLLVVEGVNNPDNVGGLFRTAAALGAGAGRCSVPSCGDPLYRKAIRTSMAAVLSLPWSAGDVARALDAVRAAGLT